MAIAGLLVSTLPSWSVTDYRVPRKAVLPLMLGAAGYVALLVAEPWAAMAAAGLAYAAMIPLSFRSYQRAKARMGQPDEEVSPAAP